MSFVTTTLPSVTPPTTLAGTASFTSPPSRPLSHSLPLTPTPIPSHSPTPPPSHSLTHSHTHPPSHAVHQSHSLPPTVQTGGLVGMIHQVIADREREQQQQHQEESKIPPKPSHTNHPTTTTTTTTTTTVTIPSLPATNSKEIAPVVPIPPTSTSIPLIPSTPLTVPFLSPPYTAAPFGTAAAPASEHERFLLQHQTISQLAMNGSDVESRKRKLVDPLAAVALAVRQAAEAAEAAGENEESPTTADSTTSTAAASTSKESATKKDTSAAMELDGGEDADATDSSDSLYDEDADEPAPHPKVRLDLPVPNPSHLTVGPAYASMATDPLSLLPFGNSLGASPSFAGLQLFNLSSGGFPMTHMTTMEPQPKRQKTSSAQPKQSKRRLYNSCHICKCAYVEDVEHVRCKCGVMFCGRSRCCKRIGMEFSKFKALLQKGSDCVHCSPNGTIDGIKLNSCPNSNCQSKKKKGVESRKYNVGILGEDGTIQSNSTERQRHHSSPSTPSPSANSEVASAMVSTIAHALEEHLSQTIDHATLSSSSSVNSLSSSGDGATDLLTAASQQLRPLVTIPTLTSTGTAISTPSSPSRTAASAVQPFGGSAIFAPSSLMLPLRAPSLVTGLGTTSATSPPAASNSTLPSSVTSLPSPVVPPAVLTQSNGLSSLDYQIVQLQAQNEALAKQQVSMQLQNAQLFAQHQQQTVARAGSFYKPPPPPPPSSSSSNARENGQLGSTGVPNGIAPATAAKLPPTFNTFLLHSFELLTKAMVHYVPLWSSSEVYEFMRSQLQLPPNICQLALTCDVDGARFLKLTSADLIPIFRLDPSTHKSEIETLVLAIDSLQKHYQVIRSQSDELRMKRAAASQANAIDGTLVSIEGEELAKSETNGNDEQTSGTPSITNHSHPPRHLPEPLFNLLAALPSSQQQSHSQAHKYDLSTLVTAADREPISADANIAKSALPSSLPSQDMSILLELAMANTDGINANPPLTVVKESKKKKTKPSSSSTLPFHIIGTELHQSIPARPNKPSSSPSTSPSAVDESSTVGRSPLPASDRSSNKPPSEDDNLTAKTNEIRSHPNETITNADPKLNEELTQ